jgi:hypothetical protein
MDWITVIIATIVILYIYFLIIRGIIRWVILFVTRTVKNEWNDKNE